MSRSAAGRDSLEHEIAFYAGAVALDQGVFSSRHSVCQPEIAPTGERITQIDGLVNINLALHQSTALCPAMYVSMTMGGSHPDWTDSGGKTTYLPSVGLAHVMFQAGLFIPRHQAESASRCDLTHFPALETSQQGVWRRSERLREVFRQATPCSLVHQRVAVQHSLRRSALSCPRYFGRAAQHRSAGNLCDTSG